eukprot:g15973.t1
MAGELPPELLENVYVALTVAKSQYAAMKREHKEAKVKLRLLRLHHQSLLTRISTETSKRARAEQATGNLKAQLEHVQDQLHSETAAREASESACRAAEWHAERYKDLYRKTKAACQYAQCIAQNKEREIAAIEARHGNVEGDYGSLQCRLAIARKGKKMDQDLSAVIRLALEGLIARGGLSSCAASEMSSGNDHGRRREVEPGASRQVVSVDGGSLAAAREAHERVRFKLRLLHAWTSRVHEAEQDRRQWEDGDRRSGG